MRCHLKSFPSGISSVSHLQEYTDPCWHLFLKSFSTRGYDRLWLHLSVNMQYDTEIHAHEGEEQAWKAWCIIYGDLNPVIHKYNYNLRLESDMDLAILITLQLCLFRSFICWQGKYKNAVSRKTINKRKYFYFTQRIFFVSVCVVHPPTFRWEI